MPPDDLTRQDRDVVADLAPALQRAAGLDPTVMVRLQFGRDRATALLRLPFGVLVSRSVGTARERPLDLVAAAADVLAWLDGAEPPRRRDHEWRSGLPPQSGWQRLDTIPDDVIRPIVRQGAMTLKDAADREGVPGAQPRAEVADTLLDSIVLHVADERASAGVPLRVLSALTRMGFLRKDGHAHVDVAGRWLRVVGEFGTVHHERPGGLGLL